MTDILTEIIPEITISSFQERFSGFSLKWLVVATLLSLSELSEINSGLGPKSLPQDLALYFPQWTTVEWP